MDFLVHGVERTSRFESGFGADRRVAAVAGMGGKSRVPRSERASVWAKLGVSLGRWATAGDIGGGGVGVAEHLPGVME